MSKITDRFIFFELRTVETTMIVRGIVNGQEAFLRLQAGAEAMARIPSMSAEDIKQSGRTVFVLDVFLLAFCCKYPKADRLPLLRRLTGDDSDELLTFCSDSSLWPCVPDGEGVPVKTICALQLWGLLQFSTVPRHPMIGVGGFRCVRWGISHGVAVTELFHQQELKSSYYSEVVECDDDATNDAVIISDDGDDGDDDDDE